MLTLLLREENVYTRAIIALAQGAPLEGETVTNEDVRDLIVRYGRRMKYVILKEEDIERFIKDNPRKLEIVEYPVLIHIDAREIATAYYMDEIFDDEFAIAAALEEMDGLDD